MSSQRRRARMRAILLATAVAVATMVAAAPAGAKISAATASHGRIGFVPSLTYQKAHPTSCTTNCSLMTLHTGGVVQHGEKLISIYWAPTSYYIPPSYKTGLSQWLTDFAKLDYGPSGDFAVAQQYYDLTGAGGAKSFVPNALVNGGLITDTDAYPANGCTDSEGGSTLPVCFTEAQLQTEVSNFVSRQGPSEGPERPVPGVHARRTSAAASTAAARRARTRRYCAYHGHLGTRQHAARLREHALVLQHVGL